MGIVNYIAYIYLMNQTLNLLNHTWLAHTLGHAQQKRAGYFDQCVWLPQLHYMILVFKRYVEHNYYVIYLIAYMSMSYSSTTF